jgi:hypothetical protein
MYRTTEGASGGNRRPSKSADDDGDGRVDEDWLDGYDNDGDGRVDEDFAAISRQMFSCTYTDDQPLALQIYPNHNPLNILVRQESYQWDGELSDDFVGVQFKITNIGTASLEGVYVGLFADADAGPRGKGNYWDDDLTGSLYLPVACTEIGPTTVDIAYTYDADGDGGQTEGYFAMMFLHLPATDDKKLPAPKINTYKSFAGLAAFENGGDPTNDFERYELLSQGTIQDDTEDPRDYRMLISAGPLDALQSGATFTFQVAFAVGKGLEGLEGAIAHAASAQLAFDGAWFNLDAGSGTHTGIRGRETPVVGPQENLEVDSCLTYVDPIPNLPPGEVIWVNEDCAREELFKRHCRYTEADSLRFRTGVAGKETRLRWYVDIAPPPPNMRIDDHAKDGVVIYWDNFSELVPDPKRQQIDFEGYHIWWAGGWTRPLGTSTETGPSHDLWTALAQFDIINDFGDDVGFENLSYEPLAHELSHARKFDFVLFIKEYLKEFPTSEPPCPQGVTVEVCDTLKALARWELGLEGGRQYYRYLDRSNIQLGRPYFYSVTAFDHGIRWGDFVEGTAGAPSSNFRYAEPKSVSQTYQEFTEDQVYVVPNPATKETMAAWQLDPNNSDPTGIKVEFRNLPRAMGIIRIYTIAADLVQELHFDGRGGVGTAKWDLVSRNDQDVTSGVYIYSIETEDNRFGRVIGKFVVIR